MTHAELENIVTTAMQKFAEKEGYVGWNKKDIETAVYEIGGTKEDFYRAVRIALEKGGEKEIPLHVVN